MTFWDFWDKYLPLTKVPFIVLIIVIVVIILWQFVFKSLFNVYLDYKSKLKLDENKLSLDYKQSTSEKLLEIEIIKVQRVLPQLEIISSTIAEFSMMYATYMQCILAGSDFGALIYKSNNENSMENNRVILDGKIIDSISVVSVYVPIEMRNILNKFRLIISCSWRPGLAVKENAKYDNIDLHEIANCCLNILSKYRSCFYDMVSLYCKLNHEETNYSNILKQYGFSTDGEYIIQDKQDEYAIKNILFYEYR